VEVARLLIICFVC